MTSLDTKLQRGSCIITKSDENPEFSVERCLDGVGISALSEWDVLVFVYRHGPSLTSAARIAHLIGYESAVVSSALDRLEREKLIEYSRSCQGARLYRIVALSSDTERHRCFQQLVNVSQSRAERALLASYLRSVGLNSPR